MYMFTAPGLVCGDDDLVLAEQVRHVMLIATALLEFYRYDDEIVEPLICSPVTRFAYVLFYRRKEDFHLSISNNLESPSSDDSTADRLYNTSCVSTSLEEERSTVSTVMEEQTHTPPPKRTIGLCETSTESSLNSCDASTDN